MASIAWTGRWCRASRWLIPFALLVGAAPAFAQVVVRDAVLPYPDPILGPVPITLGHLVVDGSERVFLAGDVWFAGGVQPALMALETTGAVRWVVRQDDESTGFGSRVVPDGDGGAFLVGFVDTGPHGYMSSRHGDVEVAHFTAEGSPGVDGRFGEPGESEERPAAATQLEGGAVVVAGARMTGTATLASVPLVIAFGADGQPAWSWSAPGATLFLVGQLSALDGGDVLMAGTLIDFGPAPDFQEQQQCLAVRLGPAGEERYVFRRGSALESARCPRAVIDAAGIRLLVTDASGTSLLPLDATGTAGTPVSLPIPDGTALNVVKPHAGGLLVAGSRGPNGARRLFAAHLGPDMTAYWQTESAPRPLVGGVVGAVGPHDSVLLVAQEQIAAGTCAVRTLQLDADGHERTSRLLLAGALAHCMGPIGLVATTENYLLAANVATLDGATIGLLHLEPAIFQHGFD